MAKVLLVEDDNNLREIFEMRLQAEGYQTVTASNGEEGLVVAMKEKPDLLVADVMMPKLSGFEMLETLRSSPETKDIKAIMMTALGQAEDQARGERVGVLKYLVKSQVTLEDFVRVIREVLAPDQKSAAAPAKPATNPAPSNDSSANNKQESENTMPDDTTTNPTPTSPTPGADAPAPSFDAPAPAPTDAPAADAPATNPISGDAADSSQLTTAQQQDAVQSQINDFASSPTPAADAPAPTDAPAAPAGDSTIPVSTPPADPGFPAAEPGNTTPPSAPEATPPTGGTI